MAISTFGTSVKKFSIYRREFSSVGSVYKVQYFLVPDDGIFVNPAIASPISGTWYNSNNRVVGTSLTLDFGPVETFDKTNSPENYASVEAGSIVGNLTSYGVLLPYLVVAAPFGFEAALDSYFAELGYTNDGDLENLFPYNQGTFSVNLFPLNGPSHSVEFHSGSWNPPDPEPLRGYTFKGWSTTWPEYTPFDGIVEDDVQLFGFYDSSTYEKKIVPGVVNFLPTKVLKNQENDNLPIEIFNDVSKLLYFPPFIFKRFDDSGGEYWKNVAFALWPQHGQNAWDALGLRVSFVPEFKIVPVMRNIPGSFDLGLLFGDNPGVVWSDLINSVYLTAEHASPDLFPDSEDLIASIPNLSGLSSGTDAWQRQGGAYWYKSGKYGGIAGIPLPIIYFVMCKKHRMNGFGRRKLY